MMVMLLDRREATRALRDTARHLIVTADLEQGAIGDASRYAVRELVTLILRRRAPLVDADGLLSRSLTLAAMASRGIIAMSSSVAIGSVSSLVGRSILAVVIELVRAATAADLGVHVFAVAEVVDGILVLAVATPNRASGPVLSLEGSAAYARAARMAGALSGQLVRGVDDGKMVFAFTMILPRHAGDVVSRRIVGTRRARRRPDRP